MAPAVAEVVFTTNMTGYQEVFTDPSYRGQIVVMTAPMIGNYGINAEDPESGSPQIAGVVLRELSRTYSNWRATGDLRSWLTSAGVPVIEGVDTRRLTRHLRSVGVMRGVIGFGDAPDDEAKAALRRGAGRRHGELGREQRGDQQVASRQQEGQAQQEQREVQGNSHHDFPRFGGIRDRRTRGKPAGSRARLTAESPEKPRKNDRKRPGTPARIR